METKKETQAAAVAPTEREAELLAIIGDLSEKLEAKETGTLKGASRPTVAHGGNEYLVTAEKFVFGGTEYELKDLDDAALLGQLVEKGVGFLELID